MIKLILVWLCVVLPLGWGVSKTIGNAKPLFQSELKVEK